MRHRNTALPSRLLLLVGLILLASPAYCLDTTTADGLKEISDLDILLPANQCTNHNKDECRTAKHEVYATNGCYAW